MIKRKPIILVDIDDTLNDFAPSYWKMYNDRYGENQDYLQVDSWNLQDYVRKDVDAYGLLKQPGFFRHLPVKKYAKQFMRNMFQKYHVYIVTDSPAGTSYCEQEENLFANPADDKRKWVADHFPYFPQDQIIICAHKWMVQGDVLVDDKPATFEKFQALGRNCILMDMPYNRHIQTNWRARDLQEAEIMIEEMLSRPG